MILDATTADTAPTTSAGSKATTDQNKLTGDLNRFLTLLVTQLQNQDPLEPLDANQFTSQLVQFASVEQQINQNANLEKLLTAQSENTMAAAVGYLGATVEVGGNALPLQGGGADASYTLTEQANRGCRDPRCRRQNRIHRSCRHRSRAPRLPLGWDDERWHQGRRRHLRPGDRRQIADRRDAHRQADVVRAGHRLG